MTQDGQDVFRQLRDADAGAQPGVFPATVSSNPPSQQQLHEARGVPLQIPPQLYAPNGERSADVNAETISSEVTLFGPVHCPHCGFATRTEGRGPAFLLSAIANRYFCPTHGFIELKAFLPRQRQQLGRRAKILLAASVSMILVPLALLTTIVLLQLTK